MKLTTIKPRVATIGTYKTRAIGSYSQETRIRGRRLQAIREAAWVAAGGRCQSCDTPVHPRDYELDHITPLYMGGRETDDNRQVLCKRCHEEKTKVDMSR
jgi:5-methylcytosine-specific restriction protein A